MIPNDIQSRRTANDMSSTETASQRVCWARDPRTGTLDYRFRLPHQSELRDRARALRTNQVSWCAQALSSRIEALQAFAEALQAHRTPLHAALCRDTGRSRIADIEIDSVIGTIRAWCAGAPDLRVSDWIRGRTMPSIRHRARFVPYPLVTVISPWNFPLLLAFIDAIPALLAGCAVWIKPSEVTPRFIEPVKRAIDAVPAIERVLALIPGEGSTGADLIELGDCVCFTGSVATGRRVAVQAAQRFIPAFLELGGKDPLIVLKDANLEAATDAALRGSVLATGQACQSIERIYVARELHDSFVQMLCTKARAVRFNYPDIGSGDLGPVIFERQAQILAAQLADARSQGARILTGGAIEHHGGGLWLAPTVVTHVTHAMQLMQEETFGPIMPIMAFDRPDEAVALANDSSYGLSAAVFGARIIDCEAIAEQLAAGAVSINDAALTAVFHEASKQAFKFSGLGPSRMGIDGFTRFMRRQAIIVNEADPVPLCAYAEDGARR